MLCIASPYTWTGSNKAQAKTIEKLVDSTRCRWVSHWKHGETEGRPMLSLSRQAQPVTIEQWRLSWKTYAAGQRRESTE